MTLESKLNLTFQDVFKMGVLLVAVVGAWYNMQLSLQATNTHLELLASRTTQLEQTAVAPREMGQILTEIQNINRRLVRIENILERIGASRPGT